MPALLYGGPGVSEGSRESSDRLGPRDARVERASGLHAVKCAVVGRSEQNSVVSQPECRSRPPEAEDSFQPKRRRRKCRCLAGDEMKCEGVGLLGSLPKPSYPQSSARHPVIDGSRFVCWLDFLLGTDDTTDPPPRVAVSGAPPTAADMSTHKYIIDPPDRLIFRPLQPSFDPLNDAQLPTHPIHAISSDRRCPSNGVLCQLLGGFFPVLDG